MGWLLQLPGRGGTWRGGVDVAGAGGEPQERLGEDGLVHAVRVDQLRDAELAVGAPVVDVGCDRIWYKSVPSL